MNTAFDQVRLRAVRFYDKYNFFNRIEIVLLLGGELGFVPSKKLSGLS